MINWAVVTAFIAPLIASLGLLGALFAWLGKKRDKRVSDQIDRVTTALEFRISQVETALVKQSDHLDKQDGALLTAMTAIARIEGRLAGPVNTIQS
jgi:uncharacterized Tic20 family protein